MPFKSEKLADIVLDVMNPTPESWSGRGMDIFDLNSRKLTKIVNGIATSIGQIAAHNFVWMIAQTPDLSATNFCNALAAYDRANCEWDPKKHPEQAPFCVNDGKRRDLGISIHMQAPTVLDELANRRNRSQYSRYDIAGEFMEKESTRDQMLVFLNGRPERYQRPFRNPALVSGL